MKYYKKRRKTIRFKPFFLFFASFTTFIIFLLIFDKILLTTFVNISDGEIKKESIEIINKSVLKSIKNIDGDILKIDKDIDGNITLINANTVKLNKLASEVALDCTKNINLQGEKGIKVPLGNVSEGGLLANIAPKINVKMKQVGRVDTKYYSEFDEAGINQTRLTIYMEVVCKIRVIVPSKSDEIEVKHKVPISESIIVGKVPQTSIDFSKIKQN